MTSSSAAVKKIYLGQMILLIVLSFQFPIPHSKKNAVTTLPRKNEMMIEFVILSPIIIHTNCGTGFHTGRQKQKSRPQKKLSKLREPYG